MIRQKHYCCNYCAARGPKDWARWPNVHKTLARSARHCAEAKSLLEEFVSALSLEAKGTKEHTLSVSRLLALTPARQRLVLRSWIYQAGFALPGTAKLQTILRN